MKKTVFNSLKESTKAKKVLRIFLCLLLGLYVFSIPSFSGRELFNYFYYAVFAALVIFIIAYKFLYSSFKIELKHCILFFFSISSLVGTILYSHAFREWATIFLMSFSFFIIVMVFDEIDNKRLVLYIAYIALFCFSIYFIMKYRSDLLNISKIASLRLGDYFDNVNAVSMYFTFGLGLSLFLALFSKNKIELLNILPSAVFAFLGITTGSRTFIITAFLLIIILLIVRFWKKKLLLIIILASLIGLVFILINLPFMSTIKNRMLEMIKTIFAGTEAEGSTIQRSIMQQYGFSLGIKNMLFGLGAHGFATFSGVGTYSHSNLSEVFCDFGIIGFICFYSVWYVCFLNSSKVKDDYKMFAVSFLIVEIIHSFFAVLFSSKISAFELALCIYLCCPNNPTYVPAWLKISNNNKCDGMFYELRI